VRVSVSRLLRVLLVTFVCAVTVHASARAQLQTSDPVFRVGDVVRVTVLPTSALFGLPEMPSFSGEFEIAEDGTVVHPLYREVHIAGMTQQQAEAAIRQIVSRYEAQPRLIVEPLFRVMVSGEVSSPGVYPLPPYATLAQAVMAAGGPLPTANMTRARIIRDGQEVIADLTRADNPTASLRVRSGDQIFIDRRRRIWNDTLEPVLSAAGSIASIVFLVLELTDQRN